MADDTVTIYHNPRCSTSRKTLQMIRDAGVEPVVVTYLTTPPSRATLRELAARMGVPVRGLLREKEAAYSEQDLGNPERSDDELLDAIERNPVLLRRPIVARARGAALCRPVEKVLDLLP